ncbi:hypothetical protein GWK53_08685 [Burkholderia cepacia]|uniref:hypothetical protein n=1 Tax=Burkholderia cepacia TaxID=292 RepID=UPI0013F4A8DC|nr:hypothetical protein [Burkholderia cepacia]NHB06585.1 hypothetical protein [Burkholderia cepacia]
MTLGTATLPMNSSLEGSTLMKISPVEARSFPDGIPRYEPALPDIEGVLFVFDAIVGS